MTKLLDIKKNLIVAISIMIMLVSLPFQVYASDDMDLNDYSEEYSQITGYPKKSRWSFTDAVITGMDISPEGEVIYDCIVEGYPDITTRILIYSYVQEHTDKGWKNIGGCMDSYDKWHGELEETLGRNVNWGYDYRIYNSIYVYSGDEYEHIDAHSAVYHYHPVGAGTDCTFDSAADET